VSSDKIAAAFHGREPLGRRVVHIAGMPVFFGERFLRQRCAWCGVTLIDYDLAMISVPVGQDPMPSTWGQGEVIAVDGPANGTNASYVVEHEDGQPLPADACARLDPAVTR
jgi:hypothetical protein